MLTTAIHNHLQGLHKKQVRNIIYYMSMKTQSKEKICLCYKIINFGGRENTGNGVESRIQLGARRCKHMLYMSCSPAGRTSDKNTPCRGAKADILHSHPFSSFLLHSCHSASSHFLFPLRWEPHR